VGSQIKKWCKLASAIKQKDEKCRLGVCDEGSDFGELNLVVTLY
jgi:hypothetical protein